MIVELGQRLHNEIRHHTPVAGSRARTIGVENARDADIDAFGVMKVVEKRLRGSFAFIVASPWPKGIDVAPIALGLRAGFRVAINLGGRRLKSARPIPRRQIQDVQRAEDGGLQCMNGVTLIVYRRGWTGKVVN